MRWLQAVVTALSILAMTGCPSEFGKDGRVNKAAAKDTQDQLLFISGCPRDRYEKVCAPGLWESHDCRKCREAGVR
jgi:hypothetical protein